MNLLSYGIERLEIPVSCHKFIKGSLLTDGTVAQNDNTVKLLQLSGIKAMCHHHACCARQILNGVSNLIGSHLIKSRSGLIKQKNLSATQETTRNAYTLTLAARQVASP